MIVKNGLLPQIVVKPGETTTVEIGKPFEFDFGYDDLGTAVKVPGSSIAVRGKNGELYLRYVGEVIQPTVHVRKKGSKGHGGRPETMKLCDQETFRTADREVPYHPLDIEVKKPGGRTDVEVMLEQRGHKWFGTITSEWK
jgi:hypothetical protein